MIKRHTRKSQQHPQGAIVEREGSIHVSNVMAATNFDARATNAGGARTGGRQLICHGQIRDAKK